MVHLRGHRGRVYRARVGPRLALSRSTPRAFVPAWHLAPSRSRCRRLCRVHVRRHGRSRCRHRRLRRPSRELSRSGRSAFVHNFPRKRHAGAPSRRRKPTGPHAFPDVVRLLRRVRSHPHPEHGAGSRRRTRHTPGPTPSNRRHSRGYRLRRSRRGGATAAGGRSCHRGRRSPVRHEDRALFGHEDARPSRSERLGRRGRTVDTRTVSAVPSARDRQRDVGGRTKGQPPTTRLLRIGRGGDEPRK